ncbi:hypothetical protein DFH06DRAFT_434538 [Mycena polygramma]|nr:hypothetical protein DFH06DRAFT_434538 [Mycena polygramma]
MSQNTRSNENTRLLSSSPAPPVNHETRPESTPTESGVMTTVWNVAQLLHGLGENVRGTILGAIDDLERKGEEKHHQVARQGKAEIEEAFQKLWGSGPSGSQPAEIPPSAQTSGYDAAPPTYQATGSVPRMDSKNSDGT